MSIWTVSLKMRNTLSSALGEWRPYICVLLEFLKSNIWNQKHRKREDDRRNRAKSSVRLSYLISMCWHQIKFYKLYLKWHVRSKHSTSYIIIIIYTQQHSTKTQAMVGFVGLKERTHDGWLSCSATQITSHCWKHNTKQQHSTHHLCPIHKTNNEDDDCVWLDFVAEFSVLPSLFLLPHKLLSQSYSPPQTKKKEERASLILNQRWRRKGVMEMLKVLGRGMNVMNVKITQITDGEWERESAV